MLSCPLRGPGCGSVDFLSMGERSEFGEPAKKMTGGGKITRGGAGEKITLTLILAPDNAMSLREKAATRLIWGGPAQEEE